MASPPAVALRVPCVKLPVSTTSTVFPFNAVPVSLAIILTFVPTDVASHPGSVNVELISSLTFYAV